MSEKLPASNPGWIDPDDAPELTEEFFERGEWKIGDKVASPTEGKAAFREANKRGRPNAAVKKVSTTIRLDADVLEAFRATGHGWQTRINNVLRGMERKGNLLKVRDFENDSGWVLGKLVNKKSHVVVKKERINMRSGPGVTHKIVGRSAYGEVLSTLKHGKSWIRVEHDNGVTGWVRKDLVWGW